MYILTIVENVNYDSVGVTAVENFISSEVDSKYLNNS